MNSKEYTYLEARLETLENNMLSVIPIDPPDSLDEKWWDIILGYIIL